MSFLTGALTETEVSRRYRVAFEAKQDELTRLESAYAWVYEFEKHLKEGEQGRAAYRFPELLGYWLRRYNTYTSVLLPEAKIRGDNDAAVGLQAAVDHVYATSNIKREKYRAIKDACGTGTGAFCVMPTKFYRYNREIGKKELVYKGLASERVDWRFIFPAPGALYLHDHTGLQRCPYLFRKKVYNIETFRRMFEDDPDYFNIDKVEATTWGNANVWADQDFTTEHETQEATTTSEFVTILEYWDQELDVLQMYATGGIKIYDSPIGIPLSHKQLPFHVYYNLKRTDSINGIGEIELNMPYNLFREKILTLGIDDVMLQVQPAKIVDGWIDFNPEGKELEAGAILTAKGPGVMDDIRKHIMDYSFGGGYTNAVQAMIQLVENSRIAVTADDTTSLYSNPNQLATQTLAKRETLNKNIDASIRENANDTEYYLANQLASFVKNELAEPNKEEGESVKYTQINIRGYEAIQEDEDAPVKFTKMRGAESKFTLNEHVSKLFDKTEIEVVEAKQDEELKRDATEKLMTFSNTLFTLLGQLAQYQPELLQQVFGDMDLKEFIRVIAKNFGLQDDLAEVFPVVVKDSLMLDMIDEEHKQIMMGITPELREDEDSAAEWSEHMRFFNSKYFTENASKEAKNAMQKHLTLTAENVTIQNSKPVATRQKEMERDQESRGGVSLPPTPGQPQGGPVQPGASPPVPMAGSPVQAGMAGGSAVVA